MPPPETGDRVITEVHPRDEYEDQQRSAVGPDLVVGYARGYRGATESASGEVRGEVFSDNDSAWSGDHMMDHRTVPGVLLLNRPLARPARSITDLAGSILAEYGIEGFPAAAGDSGSGPGVATASGAP